MARKWILCMALVGCGLSDPQGPTDLPKDPWKRTEEQRLEALEEKCSGPSWERGLLCPRGVADADTTKSAKTTGRP